MADFSLFEKRSALFSTDRRYRDYLRIIWEPTLPTIAFVGLNPSTADEFTDDPTIRRCRAFAQRDGFGALLMMNIFSFKATDPRELMTEEDPIGPYEDVGLALRLLDPTVVVACWGTHGRHRDRGRTVANQISKFFDGKRFVCFGLNGDGSPKHPLYLRSDCPLIPFQPEVC